MRLGLSRWSGLVIVLAAVADTVVASTARPFSWAADVTTALGIAGVVLTGGVVQARRRRAKAPASVPAPLPRSGAVAWVVLAVSAAAFETVNFFLQPRSEHPTISSLLSVLTSHEVTRGLLFAGWLLAGWWLWVSS